MLSFDKSQGRLAGEIVEKRFQALADALNLEAKIEFE